jgi:cation-transporting ATPase 13A2
MSYGKLILSFTP